MRVQFTGHSDDIIEIATTVPNKTETAEHGVGTVDWSIFIVQTLGGARKVAVWCAYGAGAVGATWSFAPIMLNEGDKFPSDWAITTDTNPDNNYSTRLTIETGADLVQVMRYR